MMQFDKILFTSAVIAMACDGEIHENEISEIKTLVKETPYFGDIDCEEELKCIIAKIREDHISLMQELYKTFQEANLSKAQKMLLMEVLLRIIYADKRIDDNELNYFHEIKRRLYLTDHDLLLSFPSYVDVIMPKSTNSTKTQGFIADVLGNFKMQERNINPP